MATPQKNVGVYRDTPAITDEMRLIWHVQYAPTNIVCAALGLEPRS